MVKLKSQTNRKSKFQTFIRFGAWNLALGTWILFVFGIFIFLLLASCKPQSTEMDIYKNFHRGMQGVTTTLIGVPQELLENTPFTINLKIDNLGAYPAEGLTVLSIEDTYMCLPDPSEQYCLQDRDREQAKVRSFILSGKNRYNPQGESAIVEFPLKTKRIDALSEQHTSRIIATTCYTYATEVISEICLDPGKYTLSKSKPVCEMKPSKATEKGVSTAITSITNSLKTIDQGAPIAVTDIDVDLLPEGDIVKPQLVFTLQNKGTGITIYPADKINELCSSSQVKFSETNALVIQELKLSNGLLYIYGRDDINTMICEPNPLGLKYEKDTIRCYQKSPKDLRFAIEKTQPAMIVQLSATFKYGYMDTKAQDVVIRKTIIK